MAGDRSRVHHSKARGLLIQKNDQSSGLKWSLSGQQVVLSGYKWSRTKFQIEEAIKHYNGSSGPSSSTNMSTRSGQIMFKVDPEWSKIVFV